jgi:TrmH RNA methyltransferase
MAKPPPSRKPAPDTEKVAGLPAVSALFACDPRRAERLFYDDRIKPLAGGFCQLMAKQHKPYRLVSTDELTKVAGSPLHGGILVVAKPKPVLPLDTVEARLWAKAGKPLLILDGVGNPHNLGAIARTMAFFGLERLVMGSE